MGPGLRRDDVICSEGAMNTNWITPACAGKTWMMAACFPDVFG
jgi:hypothetical protein